ncbi:MAG: hypothetical protein EU981_00975 [Candidatus Liberibacter ctenarytainae]|uniref:Pilus formation protein N-terminal domain-containing protein n=1 Tax=Candidatus Liberibacter ctenarytainae TaxID=2020335 RepID=A0A937DKX0_9HYPH|nr:hypothetical protein [Candidatus Liberibacter ctenarytainae]
MTLIRITIALSTFISFYGFLGFSRDGYSYALSLKDENKETKNTLLNTPNVDKTKKNPHIIKKSHTSNSPKKHVPISPNASSEQRTDTKKSINSDQKSIEKNKGIRIAVGQSFVLHFDEIPNKVIVGDTKIADVLVLEKDRNIVLTAKKLGTTNLITLGINGNVLVDTEIITFASENNIVRLYTPQKQSFLSCTPRCVPLG